MFENGTIVKIEWPSIQNDVGGTTDIKGIMKARITDSWYDYETGYRFTGELINQEDIERARIAGTTGRTPEDYKDSPGSLYNHTVEARKNFNPAIVYFSQHDIIIGRKKHSSMYDWKCKLERMFA